MTRLIGFVLAAALFTVPSVALAGQTYAFNPFTGKMDVVGDSALGPTYANLTLQSTLGSNMEGNGTFTTDLTGWTGTTGWSASGGKAVHATGTTALVSSTSVPVVGTVYQLTFDYVFAGTGSVTPSYGGMTGPSITESATGITMYYTATSTAALTFTPTTGNTGSIDNVTFKAISNGTLTADKITGNTSGKALRFLKTLELPIAHEVAFRFDYTVNKATSGNDTGLLVNMTDTASPGTSKLFDFQAAGASAASLSSGGILTLASSIKTGTPNGGTASNVKLGVLVTDTVVVDTSRYIQIDVNGTLYKLIIAQ